MPTLPLAPETDALLQAELKPGERILWSSSPLPSRAWRTMLPFIALGLVLAGFACVSLAQRGTSSPAGPLLASAALTPFILFGAAGLALVVLGPLAALKTARRTGYAVTTDRVLAAEAGLFGPVRLRTYAASHLGAAQLELKPDGSGSIILETIIIKGGRYGPRQRQRGLLNIPDAQLAHDTIRELAKDIPQEYLSPAPEARGPRWVAPVLLGFAGLFILSTSAPDLVHGQQSTHWPVVRGTVLRASIRRQSGRSVSYWAQITYGFEVEGRPYRGNRVSYGDHNGGSRHAHELTSRYGPGTAVAVSYDPAQPDQAAVLEPGVSAMAWTFPGSGALLTVAGMAWTIVVTRRKRG